MLVSYKSHVEVCANDRDGANANQHKKTCGIPFEFFIALPAPHYERNIISRDQKGRILRSAPPADAAIVP